MKKNYTDVTFILDRSGSMQSVKEDTIGGFNSFIESQRLQNEEDLGEITVNLFQFDHEYNKVFSNKTINECPFLNNETFVPRGATALLDAIGRTINEIGYRYNKMEEDEKPEKVIVVIITDGEENSSMEFNLAQINEMIKHQQEKYNWTFVFLGADQDAIATASAYGISANNSMTYAKNSKGIAMSYCSLSDNIIKYRGMDSNTITSDTVFFEEEDKKQQEELLDDEV